MSLSLRSWKPFVVVPVEPTAGFVIVYVLPPKSIVMSLSILRAAPVASVRSVTVAPGSAASTASASVSYLAPLTSATYLPALTPNVPSAFSVGMKPSAQYSSATALLYVPP